jgi:hypothetical protein
MRQGTAAACVLGLRARRQTSSCGKLVRGRARRPRAPNTGRPARPMARWTRGRGWTRRSSRWLARGDAGLSFRVHAQGRRATTCSTTKKCWQGTLRVAAALAGTLCEPPVHAAADDLPPRRRTSRIPRGRRRRSAQTMTPAERRTRAVVGRRGFRTRIAIAGRVLFEELERVRGREGARPRASLPSALRDGRRLKKAALSTHRGSLRGRLPQEGGDVVTATSARDPAAECPPNLPKKPVGSRQWLVVGHATHSPPRRGPSTACWRQQFFRAPRASCAPPTTSASAARRRATPS